MVYLYECYDPLYNFKFQLYKENNIENSTNKWATKHFSAILKFNAAVFLDLFIFSFNIYI